MKVKSSSKTRSHRTAKSSGDKSEVPRGYGAMRDIPLNLDPRIDLTKPIYEQVVELEKADKAGRS